MTPQEIKPNRAQISRAAIRRLYIAMNHLFLRGSYKPLGVSGEAMIKAMLDLEPEIYGSIANADQVEIAGLSYIFLRLPQGIEECRFINLISREGYEDSDFEVLVPAKRRRDCYRVDQLQMFIEMTRGKSDIYDVLTHLTFLYIEAEKIASNALDHKLRKRREWVKLEEMVTQSSKKGKKIDHKVACSHLSALIGRTYQKTEEAVAVFDKLEKVNNLFHIVYWLGYHSIEEKLNDDDREISFSRALREEFGIHKFGEAWARNIKQELVNKGFQKRPLHIISANLHSVMNALYAVSGLGKRYEKMPLEKVAAILAQPKNKALNKKVLNNALKNGLCYIDDDSGTNLSVQIIDCSKLKIDKTWSKKEDAPVILVMDYAFGEQAYECMDELLKPFEIGDTKLPINLKSIYIMGKAGILPGHKGDIMVPTAHVFEGSADNYPIKNSLKKKDFDGHGLGVYEGPMVTVLGTSLQNRDILKYFYKSSWRAIGLEMEGAHYQKAIQAAMMIRLNIAKNIKVGYAYYASDNPLETGSTLASGGLGADGVKPTYLITQLILDGIFGQNKS